MAGQFGEIPVAAADRRALVAVSTMIGAMTLSRIVTDPDLSLEILKEAEKSLSAMEGRGGVTTAASQRPA